MKKILLLGLIIALLFTWTGCLDTTYDSPDDSSDDSSDAETITVSKGSDEFEGMDYKEVKKEIEDMGFTDVTLVESKTEDNTKINGAVIEVRALDGWFTSSKFDKDDQFESDTTIQIKYWVVEEVLENLTVDNCPELAEILAMHESHSSKYLSFSGGYRGRIIEFDGHIDYLANHGDYTTRYDFLVSAGDYDPDTQSGPTFKFENVNFYELHTDADAIHIGDNVKIIAEVGSYNIDTDIFLLKPVSVTIRQVD